MGIRAAEPQFGETSLLELTRPLLEPGHVCAPRRDRIVDVETGHCGELLPQAPDVGLANTLLAQPAVGHAITVHA
jgi:hypothetical protein